MTRIFSATALVTTLSFAVPAQADISADDIMTAWSTGALSGMMEGATAQRSGNTLTISGIRMEDEDVDGNPFQIALGDIDLVETGGAVEIVLPAAYPITISSGEGGEDGAITFLMRSKGNSIVASGDPDAVAYNYSADEWKFDFTDIEIEGVDDEFPGSGAMVMAGIAGLYTVGRANDVVDVTSNFETDTVSIDLDVTEGQEAINFALQANNITQSSVTKIPLGIDIFDPMAMANPDYSANGEASYGGGTISGSFDERQGVTTFNATLAGGSTEVAFGGGQLAYTTKGGAIAADVATPELPFPVSFSIMETGVRLAMPMTQSDDQRDVALGLTLDGLEVNNGIWNLFDPGAILPRDPATLTFDLTGQGRWLINFLDPEEAMRIDMGEVPGEITQVALTNLKLAVAGALLTGEGAFTLDNSDLETFDGLPAPTGAIDLQLVGANGLMDKLIEMGLLPQEQAMGARMMMGLFAVPGDAPDTLKSRIEVQSDGQVSANGQRLR